MKNISLLTDLYQFTMMNGYFVSGAKNRRAVFDLFFRNNGQITYAVAAGLESVCHYIEQLHFTESDVAYLRSLERFSEPFLSYLKSFKFSGDIYAVEEGTLVFPNEPILIVHAPIIEAMLVETAILNIINHQTLIATKASKIVDAAGEAQVVEFGARRAHGPDAAIYGTRAAIIGGCVGTSNVLSARQFNLKALGTQAHSWIMSFDNELDAFWEFAKVYPDSCLLLVDTFNALTSGIPNAITVFKELKRKGHKPIGIRLDSGDLAYLSKKARQMLDDAGLNEVKIMASNDIDEAFITSLKAQGACIDMYGVGTNLITSNGMSSLGGVYKMAAIEDDNGQYTAKLKISNSLEKTTNPAFKELYRIYDSSNMAMADLICIKGEQLSSPLTLTHPVERWKKKTLDTYTAKKLLVKVFENGRLIYKNPSVNEIALRTKKEKKTFWDEYKRLINPHIYKVDLSDALFELKQGLLLKPLG